MNDIEELSPENKELALITAALLHDIGKIYQRINKEKNHSIEGKNFLSQIPLVNSSKTGKYVIKLVENHHTKIEDLGDLKKDEDFIKLLEALKFGDTKSASHDREERENFEDLNILALKKVFDDINIQSEETEIKNSDSYFRPLSLSSFIVNLKNNSLEDNFNLNVKNEKSEELYKNLSNELKDTLLQYFNNINSLDKNSVNTLNTILMDITRFVPAAFYYSKPTAPLYDHLKLTAALSLIKYRNDKIKKEVGMYIIGDLSGIQDYIFRYFKSESADDKASKRLRGRSDIINLVTDAVVRYILDKLNLYDFNILRSSAGGFLIISNFVEPNIIEGVFKDIEKFFMDFRSLKITLTYQEFKYEELNDELFQKSFDKLINENLNKKKSKQFSDLDTEDLKNLFEIKRDGEHICDYCGMRYTDHAVDNKYKCKMCELEEYIGDMIVKSNKIYSYSFENKDRLSNSEESYLDNSFEIKFGNYSIKYIFGVDNISNIGITNDVRIISIDEINYTDYFKDLKKIKNITYQYKFVANNVPYNDNKNYSTLKTFAEIANDNYLGVFKGDMDNLGTILSYGINNLNLTKYSAFSYYTDIFYNIILNQIAMKKGIYLVFSGGDDITGVGNIKDVLEFTEEFHQKFNLWFKNEKNITVSLGIIPIKDNYPLRQAIEMAEEQLILSKKEGKDKITIFDLPVEWNEFIDSYNFSKKLNEKIKNKSISKSFLYFLLDVDKHSLLKNQSVSSNNRLIVPDPYIHYYIFRNYKEKNKEEFYNEIIKKQNLNNLKLIADLCILLTKREMKIKNV